MTVEKLIARVGLDDSGFQAGMGKVISGAKKAALAITGLATAAAIIGAKFEFELTKTATVAQAFGKDLEALEKKARKLGATTAFTATQAATGMYDLASAGMDTNQILAATEHAMKLAGATGSEMSQATGVLASSLKQFGLEAEESKRVVDTYAQAITKSQLTMERLTEAMKYAGTAGSALGWDIEETTAAVAQFANLGLEGSMAGTNLRMAMISLSRQTSQVTSVLAELGLTYKDVNPETHSFGELLTTIGKRSISGAQAVQLFGSRAGLNMKRLAEAAAQGRLQFDSFVQSLRDAQMGAGRASEMYDRLMNTFKGKWKIMLSAAEDMFITLFDTMKDEGKDMFETLAGYFNNMSEWIKDNEKSFKEFWANVRTGIEAVVATTAILVKTLAALTGAIATAVVGNVKKTNDALEDLHGAYLESEKDLYSTPGRKMYAFEAATIYLNAYMDKLAELTGKERKDIGLFDIILARIDRADRAAQAGRDALEKARRELEKAAVPQHPGAYRGTRDQKDLWTERPGSAAPTRPEAAAGYELMAVTRAQEEADQLAQITKKAYSELEQLNAKYIMSDYKSKVVANKKEVEEVREKYQKLIDLLVEKKVATAEIQKAEAAQALAVAKKRAEVEESYIMMARKAVIDQASEKWELAQQKAVDAVELEREGLNAIEDLEIRYAANSIERLKLQGEKERRQIIEDFKKRILLYVELGDQLAAAAARAQLKAMLAASEAQTEKAIVDERVNQERLATNAILEANQQAARGKFELLKSQYEMEKELQRQRDEDVLKQLATTEEGKARIQEVAAAQEAAKREKQTQFDAAMWQERLGLASTMVGQMNQTMDALYTSGIARSKKMFKVMKAFKIVEAIINTAAAIMQALSSWPPPISWALAAMSAAMGAAQIAVIAKSQPPAYAEGGIVRGKGDGKGQVIRVGEYGDELVVPLKGGKVPVAMVGRKEGPAASQVIEQHDHYHFDNATFLDQATLAASMETISINSLRRDYYNDGPTRTLMRSRR